MLLHSGHGAGAGRLPSVSPGFCPPQLPPLCRKYFGERWNSQWGKIKIKTDPKKGERDNNPSNTQAGWEGRGGKQGRVVQSCDSQAALLPCRATRAQSCSISAGSLGSSPATGLPCFPHPPPLSFPACCLPPAAWVLPRPAHAPVQSALCCSGIEEREFVSLERGARCWVALLGTLPLGTWSAELSSLAAAPICPCLCCQSS